MFYLVLSFFGGDVKSRIHIFGGGVDFGSVLQQKHNNINVAKARSYVQWCLLFASSGVHLSAVPQQNPNDVGLKQNKRKFSILIYITPDTY